MSLIVSIAVVLCVAYLLWQIWEADLTDHGDGPDGAI